MFSVMITLRFSFFFLLRLDANKPMRYLENKAALNEALERLNWPISLKELSLLENEILAGKMYVQQAMELARSLSGDSKMVLLLNDLTDNY